MDGLTGTKAGSGVWQRIISAMPEHDVYIEPFWGRGTIAKRKRPARYTIGIDRDPVAVSSGRDVALMFLADGTQWLADYFRLPLTQDSAAVPAGEAAHAEAAHAAESSDPDCTFGGVPWNRHFVYLDPPYLGCTGYYRHELTEAQHRVLCRLFLRLPCPAMLSSYWIPEYYTELADFCRREVIPTTNRAGQQVNEIVWMNFAPPIRYHDTRYIGDDRRERERIRRRVKTWSQGITKMEPAERQAVYQAVRDAYQAATEEER